MEILGQIEAFFRTYPGLLAAAGTPLAIWVGGRALALVLSVINLRRVHQVVSPDDPALDEVEAIQRVRFPVEERDPEGILTQKIAASNYNFRGKPRAQSAMIVLYYKVGGTITAYLTAEYFKDSRTIFFWYIALTGDKARAEDVEGEAAVDRGGRKAAIKMVNKLFVICNKIGGPWEHVVAEVDSRDTLEAVVRLRRFREYAWQLRYSNFDNPWSWPALLRRLTGSNGTQLPSVFKLDLPFRMPLHEAGLVFEADKHETPAWLVVAPRDNEAVLQVGGEPVMPRETVLKLIGALRASYTDPTEPEYNAYIAGFFDAVASTVPEHCRLISRVSDNKGRKVTNRRAAMRSPRPT